MRIALLALCLLAGCGDALAASTVPSPWFGSPCKTTVDCVPAGQSVPAGVTCDKAFPYQPDSPSFCRGGVLACEVFADGGSTACGPGACCWGPTAYDDGGVGPWHDIPGKGECQSALLPGYCSRVRVP